MKALKLMPVHQLLNDLLEVCRFIVEYDINLQYQTKCLLLCHTNNNFLDIWSCLFPLNSAYLSLISEIMLMSNMKQGAKEGLGVEAKLYIPSTLNIVLILWHNN